MKGEIWYTEEFASEESVSEYITNCRGAFLMGLIKDRNGMDRAEDIKRWQEYTEKLYKKDFHDQDNHDGVTTHLEPAPRSRKGGFLRIMYCDWNHSSSQLKQYLTTHGCDNGHPS